MIRKRFEFIDEYIVTDNDDSYHYNDNHGILVRCRECVWYKTGGCAEGFGWCIRNGEGCGRTDNWYCADGEKKEDENEAENHN